MSEQPLDVGAIIGVHSAKGGVGKSTLAVNFAVALGREGYRVGLLDADVHGPSSAILLGNSDWPDPVLGGPLDRVLPLAAHGIQFMGLENLAGRKAPLIWRGAMVHQSLSDMLRKVAWGKLDYLIIDLPPGTGDALISIAQETALAGAIVVSTPQELSMADTVRGMRALRDLKVPILGLVENMAYFECGCGHRVYPFGEGHFQMLAESLGLPMLGSIPLEPEVREGGDQGRPVVLSHPNSHAGRAMRVIAKQIAMMLGSEEHEGYFRLVWRQRIPSDAPRAEELLHLPMSWPLETLFKASNGRLGLHWRETGKESLFEPSALRFACPCAACQDEWSGERLIKREQIAAELSLYEVETVGRYALRMHFSDGHQSGIFSFELLAELANEANG